MKAENLFVIDCQNDFITGSLACLNAHEAVENIISYISSAYEQDYPLKVFYSRDAHPRDHCSFTANGGTWPEHCVNGEYGSNLSSLFETDLEPDVAVPNEENTFNKGTDPTVEEYSAFNAKNLLGQTVAELLPDKKITIAGIATEFCVKETVLAFLEAGFEVTVLENALGYVNRENHDKTLSELEEKGVILSPAVEHVVIRSRNSW